MNKNSATLSFVECQLTGDGRQRISSYWRPADVGSYSEQCQEGRLRAAETVEFIRATGCPPVLGWVIGAMPRGGDMGGVEIGFMVAVAELAAG